MLIFLERFFPSLTRVVERYPFGMETFWIVMAPDPFQHFLVIGMTSILNRLEKTFITRCAAAVLRWTGSGTRHAAWVLD